MTRAKPKTGAPTVHGSVNAPLTSSSMKFGHAVREYSKYIPFLGLFFASEDVPSYEDVDKTLNLMGLVGALLCTVAMSYPTSVNREDMKEIDALYTNDAAVKSFFDTTADHGITPTGNWAAMFSGRPPSYNFAWTLSLAINSLLMEVLVVFIVLVYISFGITEEDHLLARTQMRVWWTNGGNVLMLVVSTLLVIGIVFLTMANLLLFWMKFPDHDVEGNPAKATSNDYSDTTWTMVFKVGNYIPIFTFVSVAVFCQFLHYFMKGLTTSAFGCCGDHTAEKSVALRKKAAAAKGKRIMPLKQRWVGAVIMTAEEIDGAIAEYEQYIMGGETGEAAQNAAFLSLDIDAFVDFVTRKAKEKATGRGARATTVSSVTAILARKMFEDYVSQKIADHISDHNKRKGGVFASGPTTEAGAQEAGGKSRSIAALVDSVCHGKEGISAAQREFATKMIVGLGFTDEIALENEIAFLDFARHMPGFPCRVELNLKRYFQQ